MCYLFEMVLSKLHFIWHIFNRIILFFMTSRSWCMLGEKVLWFPGQWLKTQESWFLITSIYKLFNGNSLPVDCSEKNISLSCSQYSCLTHRWTNFSVYLFRLFIPLPYLPIMTSRSSCSYVFVMADKFILRRRACEPRMWITQVNSGTIWSVVLLCYPSQDQTERERETGLKG